MSNMCIHIKYITKLDIIFTIYFIHSKNYVYTHIYIYLYIFKYCDFLSALSGLQGHTSSQIITIFGLY